MEIRWTEVALKHVDLIFDSISHDSPQNAKKVVARIADKALQISEFPYSGRKVPELEMETIRELQVYSYRLIYRILPDRIDIMAVFHGAMDFF